MGRIAILAPIASALISVASPAVGARTDKVVLLRLRTPGVQRATGERLSAILGAVVADATEKLGRETIAPDDIEAMVEHERMKSVLDCRDDAACLAEIGGALGADLLLHGAIVPFGDTFSLSLTLIDIANAKVIRRFEGRAAHPDALPATATRGTHALFSSATPFGAGLLLVETEPPGAQVRLDGRELGKAPVVVDEIVAGEHLVEATDGTMFARQIVHVRPDTVTKAEIDLATSIRVALQVLSTPPLADVYLDGDLVGKTPLQLNELPPKRYNFVVRRDGYHESKGSFVLSREKFEANDRVPFRVDISLEAMREVDTRISYSIRSGFVFDGRYPGDGVALQIQGGIFLLPWLEISAGYVYPQSIPLSVRIWWGTSLAFAFIAQGVLDLTVASVYPQLGMACGPTFETSWGRLAITGEVQVSFDHYQSAVSFPMAILASWRF
ncbi:MAG: PEGA domain-containing protein [Deltaproteobacteria bacterium]